MKIKPCVVCGGTNGTMRSKDGLWYCTGDKPCWKSIYDDRSVYLEVLKVSIICPFCDNEIAEAYENGERKCPYCNTSFHRGYDDEIKFQRRHDEPFIVVPKGREE